LLNGPSMGAPISLISGILRSRIANQSGNPELKTRIGAGTFGYSASFILVLSAGVALRLHGIADLPLIEDAFYTLRDSVQLSDRIKIRPIYFLLQSGVFQVLPVTHISLRMLSLTFGVLGIWALWAASTRLFGRTAALITAALVAFSPWHIHLSQIGRYWSLVFLEAALLFWALGVAQQTQKPGPYALAAGITVLGALTHPTFVFLVPGCIAATLISAGTTGYRLRLPKSIWRYLLLFALVSVTVIASLAVGLPATRDSQLTPADLMTTARLIPAAIQWVGSVVAVAFILGVIALLKSGTDLHMRWWGAIAFVTVITFLAALLYASLFREIYAYYLIGLLPLGYMIIGSALHRLEKRGDLRPASTLAITLLLVASVSPGIASNFRDGTRFDYRPAYRHILEHDKQVPVFGTPVAAARFYAPELDFHELTMQPDQLQQAYEAHEAIWVIASYRRYGFLNDVGGSIERWLWNHCVIVRRDEKIRFDYRRYATLLFHCPNTNAQIKK